MNPVREGYVFCIIAVVKKIHRSIFHLSQTTMQCAVAYTKAGCFSPLLFSKQQNKIKVKKRKKTKGIKLQNYQTPTEDRVA